MPPFQYPSANPEAPEPLHYVVLLEPQAFVNHGKQPEGAVLRVPESEARRLVEVAGVADNATKEDYEDWQEEKRQAAEDRATAMLNGRFTNTLRRGGLTPQDVARNMAALGNNPEQFDPAALPQKEDMDPRLKRRQPARRTPASSGRSLQDLSNETDATVGDSLGNVVAPAEEQQQIPASGAKAKKVEPVKPGSGLPADDDGDDDGDE